MPNGLTVSDGAEVRGDLHAVLVRFLDGGPELGPADPGVRLEPVHAFLGPVAHDAPRLLGPLEAGHVHRTLLARQVRARREHGGSDRVSGVDLVLQVQLFVGITGARRPDPEAR